MGVAETIARRRSEREVHLATARRFVDGLAPDLGVRAAVVFGSVARGDFNLWSDIDVLLVADHLSERPLDRYADLGELPPMVQPIAWTPAEWHEGRRRHNQIAVEAADAGVWLAGSINDLDSATNVGDQAALVRICGGRTGRGDQRLRRPEL
ncbi:hypothetical protein BH18ACT4_BH18ACT4_04110 [soil metagenome]